MIPQTLNDLFYSYVQMKERKRSISQDLNNEYFGAVQNYLVNKNVIEVSEI